MQPRGLAASCRGGAEEVAELGGPCACLAGPGWHLKAAQARSGNREQGGDPAVELPGLAQLALPLGHGTVAGPGHVWGVGRLEAGGWSLEDRVGPGPGGVGGQVPGGS